MPLAVVAMLLTACGTSGEGTCAADTTGADASGADSTEAASGDVSCEPFGPSERVESAPEEDAAFPLGDQWLEPPSPVLSLEFGGEARAHPLAIMTQHEIVNNDDVAGEPLVVTYCPLCTLDGQQQ